MKLSLVVQTAGKNAGQLIAVNTIPFIIGRDADCQLRPASALISKKHCALIFRNGQVCIKDFDSTNGTFHNEEPVKGEKPLEDGDKLKVGPLEFKVQIQKTALKSATPPAKPAPTPVPPVKAKPPAKSHNADDAAAMMLAGEDGDTDTDMPAQESDIPGGTTEMELPALKPDDDATVKIKLEEKKPVKEPPAASARDAAAAILDKMTRRR